MDRKCHPDPDSEFRIPGQVRNDARENSVRGNGEITHGMTVGGVLIEPGGDGLSGLEENGRRSRRRRRPVGAAVAVRVSDERSEELARQDERQPASRSPRPAAKPVHHQTIVEIGVLEKHIGLHMIHYSNLLLLVEG